MRRSTLLFSLLVAASLSTSAQQGKIDLGQSAAALTGPWKFAPGDSSWVGTSANGHFLWAEPNFDDGHWNSMDMTPPAGSRDVQFNDAAFIPGWTARGYPNLVRFAWYRLRIHLDSQDQPLWLEMPLDVDDGYQVYANGRFVGQMGHFDHGRVGLHYGESVELQLPPPRPDGTMVLAIRFYMSPMTSWRWPQAGGMHDVPVIALHSAAALLYAKDARQSIGEVSGDVLTGLIFLLAIPLLFWAWRNNRTDAAWFWLLLAASAQFFLSACQIDAILNPASSMAFGEFWGFTVGGPLLELFWLLFWWQWFGLRDKSWIRAAAWLLTVASVAVAFGLRLPLFGFPYTPAVVMRVCSTAAFWLSTAKGLLLLALLVEGFRRDRTAALAACAPILLLGFNSFYVPLLVLFSLPSEFWFGGLSVKFMHLDSVLMLLIVGWLALRRFLANRDREIIHRESLARDMEQARQLQQGVLVTQPVRSAICSVDVAYHPAQTVGGDFFQTALQPDGTLLLVIGDVSGKGIGAAMLVAVLVGAARACARQTSYPVPILAELNSQLLGRSGGHFATCLVAALSPEGTLCIANAGHLPPYLNGVEMEIQGALPLGLNLDSDYTETTLQLTLGDQLTFLSDGVVEAQNATGELFGFNRTRGLSTESAEAIAQAAQAFGQEDDITVLTLTFAPAEILHA